MAKISRKQKPLVATKSERIISHLIVAMLYALPMALFLSYYPIISLGSTDSMNLELSVPLIWLVIFDVVVFIKLLQLWIKSPRHFHFPGISDRRIFLLALFPLYTTISLFWSGNQLRGVLTAGIMWALFIAIFAIIFITPLLELPKNFRRNIFIAIFGASLIACAICWLQSVLDTCGVPRETTLLCRGCTYQSFGFPHPSGLAIEPQFMGNLLLAPTLLGLYVLTFNRQTKTISQTQKLWLTLVTFVISATLFLTFSRGAIYAYGVAIMFLFIVAIVKKTNWKILLIVPMLSFAIALTAQGIMATISPTSDNFATATTKAIHHLSLGKIDLRPRTQTQAEGSTQDETPEEQVTEPNFSGYVAESTDVRIGLNTVAITTWRNAPGRTVFWQGFDCWHADGMCHGSQPITLASMYFGVGLGGAGTAMHEAWPSQVASAKEIVQNQPISLLLELGIFGIDFLIFGLIVCFFPRFFSHRFIDGRQANEINASYTNFWQNSFVIPLIAMILAYAVSLNFFSGLPNALHIYLIPPIIFLLGAPHEEIRKNS